MFFCKFKGCVSFSLIISALGTKTKLFNFIESGVVDGEDSNSREKVLAVWRPGSMASR